MTESPRLRFNAACAFEIGLLLFSLIVAIALDRPLADQWTWKVNDLLLGVLAAIPPLVVILGITYSGWAPVHGLRRVVEVRVRPLFAGWPWWQLLILSILAGLGEEAFFRGVIQVQLVRLGGVVLAILATSLLFGMAHLLTNAYGIMAALMGGYLGVLLVWRNNLAVPIIAHAVYDFLVLMWIQRKKPDQPLA